MARFDFDRFIEEFTEVLESPDENTRDASNDDVITVEVEREIVDEDDSDIVRTRGREFYMVGAKPWYWG